eukprot:216018_1
MVRKVEVLVPTKHSNKIRDVLMINRSVHQLSYKKVMLFNDDAQVENVSFTFKVVNKKTAEIADLLQRYGVGNRFGTIDVIPLASASPRIDEDARFIGRKKRYRIDNHLSYDEIFDVVDSQLHLTFDYMILLVAGTIVCSVGLLRNSGLIIVASMLISPLMGPILGLIFGTITANKNVLKKSLKNEIISVFIQFTTAFFIGLITAFMNPVSDQLVYGDNTQMSSLSQWTDIAWTTGISIPIGIGVAMGVVSHQTSTLIGVAISAVLLPPIVNSGLTLGSYCIFQSGYDQMVASKWADSATISFVMFLVNSVAIYFAGIILFRTKNVHLYKNQPEKIERLNQFFKLLEDDKQQLLKDDEKTQSHIKTPLLQNPIKRLKSIDWKKYDKETKSRLMFPLQETSLDVFELE